MNVIKTYDYTDAKGNLLYQVCRAEPKAFFQRRPDGNGGWINSLDGTGKVLYRLPELLQSSKQDFVFIVEGEKDADRLASKGFPSTTNTGGALNWTKQYNEHFKGRLVALLPDNDEPGRKRVYNIANQLYGIASEIRIIELPGLPEKGDISDWLDAGHTTKEFQDILFSTIPYKPEHPQCKDSDENETISEKLMTIAKECKLLKTTCGNTYIKPDGCFPLWLCERGGNGRDWLRAEYYKRFDRPVRDGDLSCIVSTLMSLSVETEKVDIFTRIYAGQERIVIDLGWDSNDAIEIDACGCRINPEHGILFSRTQGITAPMTKPDFNADKARTLEQFHNLIGISKEDSFKLFCWLLQVWQPDAPYMIGFLTGGAGTGKSTLTGYLRMLVDPLGKDGVQLGRSPKDSTDLITLAGKCHVVAADNLSHISQDLSDTIAGLSTSLGQFVRKLYTDGTVYSTTRMVPQILNGISPSGFGNDTKDRALHISLKQREILIPLTAWWKAARELAPDIIGILCQACSFALHNLDNIPLEGKFRMADACRWIAAAQPFLTDGTIWSGLDFAQLYGETRGIDAESVIEDDPLIHQLQTLIQKNGQVQGTSAGILSLIEDGAKRDGIYDCLARSGQWPKNPAAFGKKLAAFEPLLKDAGIFHIELSHRRHCYSFTKQGVEGLFNESPV